MGQDAPQQRMVPPQDEPAASRPEPVQTEDVRTHQPEPQVQGRRPAAANGPPQCLLVDDSRMIRKVARRIIESVGYQVNEAENGEEALAKCKIAMPDLILLDWDMPVMTGIEFLAALRATQGAKRPKVVFCTTKSGAFDIHKGIDVGADEYVTKPFNEASLLDKLIKIGAA